MNKEIIEFIEKRFKNTNAGWNNENSYWFAKILQVRFGIVSDLDEIYYFPAENHFAFCLGETYYDYNGVYKNKNKGQSLATILSNDLELYSVLLKNYIR